jgi:phage shock protein PspC (stress-responsive transcriptional regulator)
MSIADEIEKLQRLRDRGALSEPEFERAKARVLDASPATGGASASVLQRLARSRRDRMLGGVCGGLGRHTDLPAWTWRIIFCLTLLYFGAGALIYLLLWIFLPPEAE